LGLSFSVPFWMLAPLPLALAVSLWRLDRRPRPGLCPRCRYDLSGSPPGPCPECGHASDALAPKEKAEEAPASSA
jgi:hypothetical protein